jgi:hypothetical protein
VSFEELDFDTFIYQALGRVETKILFSIELAKSLAKSIIATGIKIPASSLKAQPHVAAICSCAVSTSTSPKFYVNGYSNLSRVLNTIERGAVRRLLGVCQDPGAGSFRKVLFLISGATGNGHYITVVPRLECSDDGTGAAGIAPSPPPSPSPPSPGTACTVPVASASTAAPLAGAPLAPTTATTTDPSLEDSSSVSSVDGMDIDSDSPSDVFDFVDMSAALSAIVESEDFLEANSGDGNSNSAIADTTDSLEQRAFQEMNVSKRGKRALVIQMISGKATLVLYNGTTSYEPCDADLLTVVGESYVPFGSRHGTQTTASSPYALKRIDLAVSLAFGECWPLSKGLRALKRVKQGRFHRSKYHPEAGENLIDLSLLLLGDSATEAFKRMIIKISVRDKMGVNTQGPISLTTPFSCENSPAGAVAAEFGITKDGHLAVKFLNATEACIPPWKFVVPEFNRVTTKECVAALKRSNSAALELLKLPKKTDAHRLHFCKSYFRAPGAENRTEGTLFFNEDSPLRRAASTVYAVQPSEGADDAIEEEVEEEEEQNGPTGFAVILLPSNEVVRALIKYDDSGLNQHYYIKLDKDTLILTDFVMAQIDCAEEDKKPVYVSSKMSEKYQSYGPLIALSHQPNEEDDASGSASLDMDALAQEAVENSRNLGGLLGKSSLLRLPRERWCMLQFSKGKKQARGRFATAGTFGTLAKALCHSTPGNKIKFRFARPDGAPGITNIILRFSFLVNDSSYRFDFLERDNPQKIHNYEVQKAAGFEEKIAEIGVVAGSSPAKKIGLQLQCGPEKRKEIGGVPEGEVPYAWELCNLPIMEMLRLLVGVMVEKPTAEVVNAAIDWLRSKKEISEDEKTFGQENVYSIFEGLLV